jgi:hypothetical protein
MKTVISVAAVAVSLALASPSAYAGRVANTAIGTLTGLVVFGPVGAVAGAAVGYTAGNGIARSWGLSRPQYRPARDVQRKAHGSGIVSARAEKQASGLAARAEAAVLERIG